MATLTRTTHHSTFTTPAPAAASLSFDEPSKTHTRIPAGSAFETGYHWHNDHAESFKVLSSAMLVTINNKSFVVTDASPAITIPRKARHETMRWDGPGRRGHQKAAQEAFRKEMVAKGQSKELEKLGVQEVEVREWTTPVDGEKEVFFRNFLSAVSEPRTGVFGQILKFVHVVIIFQGLDTSMVLLDMGSDSGQGWRGMVEKMIWWIFVGVAVMIGGIFGLNPVSEAYTPGDLMSNREQNGTK